VEMHSNAACMPTHSTASCRPALPRPCSPHKLARTMQEVQTNPNPT
jgi:hypothetical protein